MARKQSQSFYLKVLKDKQLYVITLSPDVDSIPDKNETIKITVAIFNQAQILTQTRRSKYFCGHTEPDTNRTIRLGHHLNRFVQVLHN